MKANFKFEAPVLDNETQEFYKEKYGIFGKSFINILNTSPDEIAVISKMIAYTASLLSEKETE